MFEEQRQHGSMLLRGALSGGTNAGKTHLALEIASKLSDACGGDALVIDTELGRSRWFDNKHRFRPLYTEKLALDMRSKGQNVKRHSVEVFQAAIDQAYKVHEKTPIACLLVDNLSHEWDGVDGCLERHERLASGRNGFAVWKDITPKHNRVIESLLGAPFHVLVTLRVKTQWEMVKNSNGKIEPVKLGITEVQRSDDDGRSLAYEFDLLLRAHAPGKGQPRRLEVLKSMNQAVLPTGSEIENPGSDVADKVLKMINLGGGLAKAGEYETPTAPDAMDFEESGQQGCLPSDFTPDQRRAIGKKFDIQGAAQFREKIGHMSKEEVLAALGGE